MSATNLPTLSTFELVRMLHRCAHGSATQREIQAELRSREQHVDDSATLWLFDDRELQRTRKRWCAKSDVER